VNISGKVLCVGDIILDSYSEGEVDRISPEAPIPVLKINKEENHFLGGCGNVARNICAAGGTCHLISIVGNDKESKILKNLSKNLKNLSFNFIVDNTRCTTKKKRFVSDNQQILRVDSETTEPINFEIESKILKIFEKMVNSFDVVVISDYNKGFITPNLAKNIINTSKKKKKKIIVDPKRNNFSLYKNATIITPNFKELLLATNSVFDGNNKNGLVKRLSKKIIKDFEFDSVITTMSSDGMIVVQNSNKAFEFPSKAKEVFDVSGAGDTVVAYVAVEISRGEKLLKATELANEAAGIVVGKFGTATVSREEMKIKTETNNKLCSLKEVFDEINHNQKGKKIGFTNGCFDLIHQGHIDYLKKARSHCDFLILAINSDFSVSKIKGKERPIINQAERSIILANFNFIDRIIIFNDETPIKIIKKLKPNLIFKGDDYKKNEVVGNKEISKWGGDVILIKCLKGKSTSNIIKRIKYGS